MILRFSALLALLAALAALTAIIARPKRQPEVSANPESSGNKADIVFQNVCAACHGLNGEGKMELKTPSIAALPDWYVISQLRKFQKDIRGAESRDLEGIQMRAIAHTLNDAIIENLGTYVEQLPKVPTRNTLGGDHRRGKEGYQIYCEACHRYNASGEFAFKSAPLTGLQDWYMASQLEKFRQRIRGGHPNDIEGAKMQIPSERFMDAQEEIDVLAYIAHLANKETD